MTQSSVTDNPKSFSKTVINMFKSYSDIEQSSYTEDYTNDQMAHYDKSDFNIKIFDNILLNKYYQKIKSTATIKYFEIEEKAKYNYKPELLSTDEFQTPNLWYLILFLNGCECAMDFYNMSYCLLPDLATIEECIQNEEFIVSKEIK